MQSIRYRLIPLLFCFFIAFELLQASPSSRAKFDQDKWVRAKVDALVSSARAAFEDDRSLLAYRRAVASIMRTIRSRNLGGDQRFTTRYRRFVEYVRALSVGLRDDHQLGFAIADDRYFREVRRLVEVPDFLLKPDFLRSVSRYETLDRAKEYLRKLNSTRETSEQLLYFSYTSRHLGTPDNDDSFRRLLIVVPGDRTADVPEKWVQFGVSDPGARARIRNLSVVSARVNEDGTYNTYFKDYFRTFLRDGSIRIKGRLELGFGDDNCTQCHKSGVLPVLPEQDSVTANELQALDAVNRRFLTYGSPRFGNFLEPLEFGPGLGSSTPEDRDRRFGKGFSKTAVGAAMRCTTCHRPERLGSLNWPMDSVLINSFVTVGHMPPGSDLTETQRNELYEKLVDEYFAIDDDDPGILKSWLVQEADGPQ
jgi:hypothetical protein